MNHELLLKQLSLDPARRGAKRNRQASVAVAGILSLAAIISIGGWAVFAPTTKSSSISVAQQSPSKAETQIVAPKKASIGGRVDASGYVVARRQATVSAKVTGRVVEVAVEEGQLISQGQVIARLDATAAQAYFKLAEARLRVEEANLVALREEYENKRPSYIRTAELERQGVVGVATLERAKTDHDLARHAILVQEHKVAAANADVGIATRAVEDMTVRAPFSGVLTARTAQPGEIVSPDSAGGGFTRTGLGTIVDMTSLEAVVDVSEAAIAELAVGQVADLTFNAYQNLTVPGKIVAILPSVDRAKGTVSVRVGFDAAATKIYPDMSVRASFDRKGTLQN